MWEQWQLWLLALWNSLEHNPLLYLHDSEQTTPIVSPVSSDSEEEEYETADVVSSPRLAA